MRCMGRIPSLHAIWLLGSLVFATGFLMGALTTSFTVMPQPGQPGASSSRAPRAAGGPEERGGEDDQNSDAAAADWQRHALAIQSTHDAYFTMYDVSKKQVYSNTPRTLGTVVRMPSHLERAWFVEVQHRAVAALGGSVTSQHCTSVRYRVLEGQGVEVEVSFMPKSGIPVNVSLLQRLTAAKVVGVPSSPEPSAPLHIAMALSGRLQELQLFLRNLQYILRSSPQFVVLTVVYFEDGMSEQVASALKEPKLLKHGLQTELFIEQGPFSRAMGLRTALQRTAAVGPQVVTWLCDVDMLFTAQFIERCRSTPQLDKQMFLPVVFSQYNPSLSKMASKSFRPMVHRLAGYWRMFGHGNVCAYRQDLLTVKAFEGVNSMTWGGEDLELLDKIVFFKRHRIVRSLEPGLLHRYHPKSCKDVSKKMEIGCLSVRIKNEAAQQTFGLMYYGKQQGWPGKP